MATNDNDAGRQKRTCMPDPHGRAALLLVESLLHGLIARSVISNSDAIEIVDTAEQVQVDIADEADDVAEVMWQAHTLLSNIAESLKLDSGSSSPPLRPVP